MQPKSFVAFISFIMLAAGTYCPLLRPFGLVRLNLYDLNKPYGLIIILVAVAGIITVVLNQRSVAKIIARVSLLLVIILYVAAYLKVHNTFSFIPFKGVAGYLAGQIKFTWGWFVLFAGAMLGVLATAMHKKVLS